MILLLKILICLTGLYFAIEGSMNVVYWRDKTHRLFQAGRIIRFTLGCLLIVIAILGD